MPDNAGNSSDPRLPRHRELYYGGGWHESDGRAHDRGHGAGDRRIAGDDGRRHRGRCRARRRGGEKGVPRLARYPRAGARESDPPAAAAILLQNADELAWLEALDTGNPFQAMRFDVEISAAYMEYFAGLVTEIKGSTIPIGPGTLNYTLREPLGVVGRIGAFNHPLLFTAGKCGAPLATGNTLVVKPADQTPLSSLRIAELWEDIFPPGVFNVVTGGRDAGVALVAHPKVAKIGFIGSVTAGRAVMAAPPRR